MGSLRGLPDVDLERTRANDGCPEEEDLEDEDPEPSRQRVAAQGTGAEHLPEVQRSEDPAHGLRLVRLVPRSLRHRRQLILCELTGAS